MTPSIFVINADGILEINKPEIRNIKEFRAITSRDKGGKVYGDHDGRRKIFSSRELMYIYTFYRFDSKYRDMPEETREIKARQDAELPDDWTPDKIVKAAGAKYIELQNISALHHTYINANRAVYALGEDLAFFNKFREKTRRKIEEKAVIIDNLVNDEEIQSAEAELDRLTERLMNIGNKILVVNDKLPKAYDNIEELKQKLMKEQEKGAGVYGGGDLGNRER